jgi:asparagine synthase (glutamine-hydrolysing)
MLRRWTSPKFAGLFEYGGSYAGAYLLRRSLFMPWELPGVLDPDLVRDGWRLLESLEAIEATTSIPDSPRSTVSCMESCWYMRNQLLRDADWAGMAHSLEIRVPLVDLKLLRFVAASISDGFAPDKTTLASAPATDAAEVLLRRPKTGFTVPVREWLSRETPAPDRGLRGWSQAVYGAFAACSLPTPPKAAVVSPG